MKLLLAMALVVFLNISSAWASFTPVTTITDPEVVGAYKVKMGGDFLVYSENGDSVSTFTLFNWRTNERMELGEVNYNQFFISPSGQFVAWIEGGYNQETYSYSYNVRAYDTMSEMSFIVQGIEEIDEVSVSDSGRVFWSEWDYDGPEESHANIWMWDLVSGTCWEIYATDNYAEKLVAGGSMLAIYSEDPDVIEVINYVGITAVKIAASNNVWFTEFCFFGNNQMAVIREADDGQQNFQDVVLVNLLTGAKESIGPGSMIAGNENGLFLGFRSGFTSSLIEVYPSGEELNINSFLVDIVGAGQNVLVWTAGVDGDAITIYTTDGVVPPSSGKVVVSGDDGDDSGPCFIGTSGKAGEGRLFQFICLILLMIVVGAIAKGRDDNKKKKQG